MDRVSLHCAAIALLASVVLAAGASSASALIVHPAPGKTVSYQPLDSVQGQCSYSERSIIVDKGLPGNARVATLIHERSERNDTDLRGGCGES